MTITPWARSPLRWAGSKKQLLPILLKVAPAEFCRYVEPFAGSCRLFFALGPCNALLGDNNPQLINALTVMTAHPRLLIRAVHKLPATEEAYYEMRSQASDQLSAFEQAVRFLYLNRYCFNGVYRINRQGQFNVPMGKKTGAPPSEAEVYRCSVALRKAELFEGDFETCVSNVRKGDFVYLDPPYAKAGDPKFGEYGYDCFKAKDIRRLSEALRRIDSVGGQFILSYEECPDVKALMHKWCCQRIEVRRHVAGFSAERNRIGEVLISNFTLNG